MSASSFRVLQARLKKCAGLLGRPIRRKTVHAVNDASLLVREGEIMGLVSDPAVENPPCRGLFWAFIRRHRALSFSRTSR